MISKRVILFADNHSDFLDVRKRFLERAGFQVVTATSPNEARHILTEQVVDLAIIDMRLEDDDNPNDISGLGIAFDCAPFVPKIIHTSYASSEMVRRIQLRSRSGQLAIVEFVEKSEGGDVLLKTVQTILGIRSVFIVHGHDDAIRESVVQYIRQLHLTPVVLQDEPGKNNPIIYRLQELALSIAFVIVLLTPDDIGYLKSEGANTKKGRARQNVIFELGFFIGRLNLERVRVLTKGIIEMPSDIDGLLRIPMDSGDWKLKLARELVEVGIPVDLNNSF